MTEKNFKGTVTNKSFWGNIKKTFLGYNRQSQDTGKM
jgi:hypothetical protein